MDNPVPALARIAAMTQDQSSMSGYRLMRLFQKPSCLQPVYATWPLAKMTSTDQVPIKVMCPIWHLNLHETPDPRIDRPVVFPHPRRMHARRSPALTQAWRRRPRRGRPARVSDAASSSPRLTYGEPTPNAPDKPSQFRWQVYTGGRRGSSNARR